jgi:dipeptidyl-peptidase-4
MLATPHSNRFLLAFFSSLCLASSAAAQQSVADSAKPSEQKASSEAVKFDLETLFPEKGLFGPSASGMAFSHDGAFAAWLYRPYRERRHGSDLWVHDFATGVTKRMTSVAILAPYQSDTREVADDRIAKVKKERAKQKKDDKGAAAATGQAEGQTGQSDAAGTGSWKEFVDRAKGAGATAGAESSTKADEAKQTESKVDDLGLADEVLDGDAEDEKAPRYAGVGDFTWSPNTNELLFTTGGDVYRWVAGGAGFERLTRTRNAERSVQYLPDGTGYTSLANDALVRARFGTHFVDQLDPRLPDGQTMRSYALSQDGEKVVFVSSNAERGAAPSARKVNIATYSDRFMQVREVARTVSDDPVGDVDTAIYLYKLPTGTKDDGELVKVYSRERTGPRDALPLPDWAPDSSKVAFAVFEQASSQVHVLEATFPKKPEKPVEAPKTDKDAKVESKEAPAAPDEPRKRGAVENSARVVLRFLHDGGPNTPNMIQPRYLADSKRLVLVTEQTGFRHLHLLDPAYETLEPLTRGRFEVYPIEMPRHRESIFVSATTERAACLDVYELRFADGVLRRLTTRAGQYDNAAVSSDGKRVLATYSAYGALRELVLVDVEKQTETALTDSHPAKTRELMQASPELFSYENRHGQTIQGLMWKPADMQPGEKRPLLLYVYGGPLGTRKQVTQGNFGSDAYLFAQYMTREHGYVTCTIDPRGMSGYGALFEKANFEQVGKPQVEDLVDGVRYMVANHGVDADRVGMHGWSFGGFQTQMCLYTEPKVFKCGIAGAGPTEWENYNSWYSTGTIGGSREGKTDLSKYSLLPLAKNLESKLLLVHGMEDSNVLYQDTVRVYAELLKAGKETLVELFLDPTGGHGLGGHVKSLNRYRKYEEFLVRCLGRGATPPAAPGSGT